MTEKRPNLELIRYLCKQPDLGMNMDENVRQVVLFGRWGEILKAAPLALHSMGECYIAAAHPMAALIELTVQDSPYKHVQSNLARCADLGRDAFQEAQSQMNRVQMSARHICEPRGLLDKITMGLERDALIKTLVPRCLKQLEEMAERCEKGTEIMEDKFKAWLVSAQHIHNACGESHDDTVKSRSENKTALDQAESKERFWKNRSKEYEKEKNKAETELDEAKTDMRKAYKQTKPSLRDTAMDWCENIGDFGKGVTYRGLDVAKEVAKNYPYGGQFPIPFRRNSSSRERERGYPNEAQGPSPGAQFSQPQNAQAFSDSASFVLTNDVESHFQSLCEAVTQDGGITIVTNYTTSRSQLLGDVINGLQVQLNQRALSLSTDGEVVAIRNSLTSAFTTAKEIQEVAEEVKKNPQKTPSTQTADIWKRKLNVALSDYQNQANQIKNRKQQNPTSAPQNRPQKMSRAEHKLERLKHSIQVKDMMQQEYRRSQEKEEKAKQDLLEAEMRAKQLRDENMTLAKVIGILRGCLNTLVELKNKIGELNRFFSMLHTFVQTLAGDKMETLKILVESGFQMLDEGSSAEEMRAALLDTIKEDANRLRVYYAVTFEVASMYVGVSNSQIMPGLEMLGKLSLMNHQRGVGGQKDILLSTYLRNSQSSINNIADKKQNELRQALGIDVRGEAEEVYEYS